MSNALYYSDNLAAAMEQIADQIAEHEYEFKAFLCGALTLVTAVVIVRDLVVGISGFSDVFPLRADNALRYARADRPISYSIMIILKIALLIFFGVETLHFIGLISDDPFLILGSVPR
jgi:hypothetical protein